MLSPLPMPRRASRKWLTLLEAAVFIFIAALISGGGCANRKNFNWQTASLAHPRIPERPAAAPVEDPPPDLPPGIPPPSRLILAHASPPRPKTAASNGGNSAAPAMAPQLGPAESAEAQQQTLQDVGAAQANLGRLRGRTLTPAQSEMNGKAHDFVRKALKAGREKDWIRARNLAEKAKLLSEELLRSL